jgi:nucleoid DNA-binding protein
MELEMAKKKPGGNSTGKALSKSQVYSDLAEAADLSRKQVAGIFDGLTDVIKQQLGKKGPGLFTVPGLMKIKVVRKKATKERVGVNPFTGEQQVFKAKPARNVVKVLPLKALKAMV